MNFRVALIGCGMMGRTHARIWAAREDSRVVAVFDPDGERAAKLADQSGARVCSSWTEAVELDGVNVVDICTPVCLHAEIAVGAAERGRHVITEKPVALDLESADAMIAAAEAAGVRLAVSYQYRGRARNRLYREMISGGRYGEPLFFRFVDVREVRPKLAMHRRSMNGGPVIDMAGHFFDLVRFLTGEEPVTVCARGQVFGAGKPRLAGVEDLAVDTAEITVGYSGGHTLSAFVGWGMPEGTGTITEEIFCGPDCVTRFTDGRLVASRGKEFEAIDILGESEDPVASRIDDLREAILTGRDPEVSGREGRIALSVSLAALESIRSGRVVELV